MSATSPATTSSTGAPAGATVAPAGTAPDLDPRLDAAPSAARLVAVELRKAVDTRAGFWLLVATALASTTVVVLRMAFGATSDRTLEQTYLLAQLPVNLLLPVIGILLVTSEWSQRTALTTFALVPHRGRVIGAKLVATVVLAVVATVVALAAVAAGFAIGTAAGVTSGGWSLSAAVAGQVLLAQVLAVLLGLGFGLLLLSSAPAIVAYFVLPTVWSILGSLIAALRTPAEWLDTARTMGALFESTALTGRQWAQLGTSVALWVLVPLLVGLWRLRRKEIS